MFTASLIEVPPRLETFTKFHIAVKVSLTRQAFDTARDHQTEDEETKVKDRKQALTWLFTQIGLVPADVSTLHSAANFTDSDESNNVTTDIRDDDLTREVTVHDLQNIYKYAQKLDRPQTEREPSPHFQVELRPYQKEALAIMVEMENEDDKSTGANGEPILSPLWRRFLFPNTNVTFYMNPYTGELSLKFVPMEKCRGGILAGK